MRRDPDLLAKVVYRAARVLRTRVQRLCPGLYAGELSERDLARAVGGRWPSSEAFAGHLRDRESVRFFIDPGRRTEIVHRFRSQFPDQVGRIVAAADALCEHVFDVLGSGPMYLGDEIDWQADFKVGWRWPDVWYLDIEYLDLDQPYDVKVPWELGRFQHIAILGQAYWLTDDPRYAIEFASQIESWLDQCPPGQGVQWACPMDVAIRAVNWIWAYHFFAEEPVLPTAFWGRFGRALLAHGRHLWRNLEWGLNTNNHFLSDLVGLVYLGVFLPECAEARHWLDWGVRQLGREANIQVYADGVDYEGAFGYHRLVAELLLSGALLCRLNAIEVPSLLWSRLEKMIEFTWYCTQGDGTVPLVGDGDDGRLHKLALLDAGQENADHRHLLGLGAYAFGREEWAAAAHPALEDAFWLSGGSYAPQHCVSGKDPGSRVFPDSQVVVMRDGELHMTIDAGRNGTGGGGGHAHNDVLSLTLCAYGRAFVVDPGTFVYTADYRWRNHFRSTAAHNVIVVDEQEQQRFDERDLFHLEEDARPEVLLWHSTAHEDLFDGRHYGYERLPDPVTLRRQVLFDKDKALWLVRDLSIARGQHTYAFRLHLAPLPVDLVESSWGGVTRCLQGPNLAVLPLLNRCLLAEVESDWVSPSYGRKVLAPVLCYRWQAVGESESCVALVPLAPGEEVSWPKIRGRAEAAYTRMMAVIEGELD